MNITREQLKLYAVTDRSWLGSETLYEQVEKALKGGVTLVQLREKTLDEAAFEKEGQELLELFIIITYRLSSMTTWNLQKKSMQTKFISDSLIWR